METGLSYDQLRGVSIEGTATIIEDTDDDEYWAAGISVFERYQGEYTDEMRPFVEMMMNKRVVVRVDPTRVRSWDHREARPGGDAGRRLHRPVPLIRGAAPTSSPARPPGSGGPPVSVWSVTVIG